MVVHRVLFAVDQELTHKLLHVAENAHNHGENWNSNDPAWPAVSFCLNACFCRYTRMVRRSGNI